MRKTAHYRDIAREVGGWTHPDIVQIVEDARALDVGRLSERVQRDLLIATHWAVAHAERAEMVNQPIAEYCDQVAFVAGCRATGMPIEYADTGLVTIDFHTAHAVEKEQSHELSATSHAWAKTVPIEQWVPFVTIILQEGGYYDQLTEKQRYGCEAFTVEGFAVALLEDRRQRREAQADVDAAIAARETAQRAERAKRRQHRPARRKPAPPTEAELAAQRAERIARTQAAAQAQAEQAEQARADLGVAWALVITAEDPTELREALTLLRSTALQYDDHDTAAEAKRRLRELR